MTLSWCQAGLLMVGWLAIVLFLIAKRPAP